jgi:hypothetical protein
MSTPSRQQVLRLYRDFMRSSSRFNNYNFKNYFLRRSRDAFQESKALNDEAQIAQAFQKAREEFNILDRQSRISQMYAFEKLVVEPLDSHHRK